MEREKSRGYGIAFEIFREETEKLFKYSKNPHIHVANFPPSISLADFETQYLFPSVYKPLQK